MKRQTLLIGGALLATTALSTSAYAAIISANTANGANSPNVAITPVSLATTVFGATGATSVTLGTAVGLGVNIDMSNSLTTSFDIDLSIAGAEFSNSAGPVTLLAFREGSVSSTLISASFDTGTACTVQVLQERILVDNCVSTETTNACRIDVIQLSGIRFNQANGLATAGSSIALSGIVTGNTGNQTFELITGANVVTSAAPLTTTVVTGGTSGVFTINNSTTPPFSALTVPTGSALANAGNGTTNAILATVASTVTGATGTDLSTALAAATAHAGMTIQVNHDVLSDPAVTDLQRSGVTAGVASASGSALAANSASFTIAVAATVNDSFELEVNFSGTTAIAVYGAGTVAVSFTIGGANAAAPATVNGTLASFSRGGFQAQINTAQSTAVSAFDSFVRITNNGSIAGTASIQVADDSDGSVYGTYPVATIAPNSTVQISMAQIEAGTTGLTTPAGQYMLNISGAISGYAQHVMLNTQNGTFVDLSGFRIGNATTGFP